MPPRLSTFPRRVHVSCDPGTRLVVKPDCDRGGFSGAHREARKRERGPPYQRWRVLRVTSTAPLEDPVMFGSPSGERVSTIPFCSVDVLT